VLRNTSSVDLSKYTTVFCDSLQALEWAYNNGLSKSAIIKSSAPAVLWDKKKTIYNVESRWTVHELEKFQGTIQKLTEDIFDIAMGVTGVERDLALTISQSTYHFQKILYKASCLEVNDFTDPRLFIYVDGKTGPADKNMMNSPWDKLLLSNKSFSMIKYTLCNDEWDVLTTQGVSYWRRFKVAGYETIIYRLAIKLMKLLPNWLFTKEVLIPNENELNIEIASSLTLHGVKISEIKLDTLFDFEDSILDKNIEKIYKSISPIMRKRVEEWVVPQAVDITMTLFESCIKKQVEEFIRLVDGWERVVVKSDTVKQSVLVNSPGNAKCRALAHVCRKNGIPIMSSQHGVTVEISKIHSMLSFLFDNTVADAMFSYNSKIVDIEKNIHFDNAKHYIVGMPMRLSRMGRMKAINKFAPPIVYISTNLYHAGFSLSSRADYDSAISEHKLITKVLRRLPYKVRYKTYPEDNRRYADMDPVLHDVRMADNMELFNKKIDMRYLVSEHRILVTTCATSTLSWPVMSGKPVIFINQKHKSPLTEDAYSSLSRGIFVFNNDEEGFYDKIRIFLSKPIDEIEYLWRKKKSAREDMMKEYFSAYSSGAGARATKIILKEYLT